MIDIHSHILPGVDDGASDWEEALEMLRRSAEQDTTKIILTPHTNTGLKDSPLEVIRESFEKLVALAREEQLPIELALGMEVFADTGLEELLEEENVLGLNGSRYVLLENSFSATPDELIEMMETAAHCNKVPILAHAERFVAVQKHPDLATEWNKRGYGIQVNQGSLFGRFGEKEQRTAQLLLDHNLVQFIATDCHGVESRTAGLASARAYLNQYYTKGYAELLLEINPLRVWEDRDILIINPRYPGNR